MFALILALLCLANAQDIEIHQILEDGGDFFDQFVMDSRYVSETGQTSLYLTTKQKCVHSFDVTTKVGGLVTLSEMRIVGGVQKYVELGSVVAAAKESTQLEVDDNACASYWKLAVNADVETPFESITLVGFENPLNKKRQEERTSCFDDEVDDWPITCRGSSAGSLCLALDGDFFCACRDDDDCYNNADFPYCSDEAICDRCTLLDTSLYQSDFFCRDRFPGYTEDTRPSTSIPVTPNEQVPFYREFCVRTPEGADGACLRCNQAISVTNEPFEDFSGPFSTNEVRGIRGTLHCYNMIGDAANSRNELFPICHDRTYYRLIDIEAIAYDATVEGRCEPCVDELECFPIRTAPFCDLTTGNCRACATNAECGARDAPFFAGANCMANGACVTCVTDNDCGNLDGGIEPNQPTCGDDGICRTPFTCNTNTDCQGNDPNFPNCNIGGSCIRCTQDSECGLTDGGLTQFQPRCDVGTGICNSCTSNANCGAGAGGNNCQSSGLCLSCSGGAQTTTCGNSDGGETANQPICGNAGRCIDRCTTNSAITGQVPCTNEHGGVNCNVDGLCITCGSDLNCGSTDGGSTMSQSECEIGSGICVTPFQCTNNASCLNRGGNNCQADRTCVTCVNDNTCGSLDGGEIGGQSACDTLTGICFTPFVCSTNGSCVGNGGNNCQSNGDCITCTGLLTCSFDGGLVSVQPNCNIATGICVEECNINSDCVGTQGANCMNDGTCVTCVSDTTCNPDGGEISGQSECNLISGICETPFLCTSNGSCSGRGGNNCQADRTCVSCAGTASCGTLDGGLVNSQPNCFLSSRICIDRCFTNADCIGTQGANCDADGVCRTCLSDANCGTTDGGENTLQSECNVASGICVDPFVCSTNPSCTGNGGANCQADTSCRTCTSANDCGALDGGEISGQPVCDTTTGICGFCTHNNDCPSASPNCGSDGFCYDCRLVGNTCGSQDGPPLGPNNNQNNCDEFSGICVDFCTLDVHCQGNDASCNNYCNVERGCCVECLDDTHCPAENWRGTQLSYNKCSVNSFTCVEECSVDDDCNGALGACASNMGECVECVSDSHCAGARPACHTGMNVCVSCTADSHCVNGACSPNENLCVECVSSSHCADGLFCFDESCVECSIDSHCNDDELCSSFQCVTDPASVIFGALFVTFVSMLISLF